jgi:hypothetical protein
MREQVPKVRFRVAGDEDSYAFWLPRRLIILHLNRPGDGPWVAATFAQRRNGQVERLEGFVARRDL